MIDISFREICNRINKIELPEVDFVIGVARGGVVPASLVASRLDCELKIITINYRNDENIPHRDNPKLLKEFLSYSNLRILLIDDVSVSGKTIDFAKSLLKGNSVTTLVMKGKGDIVLFPEVKDCVHWPWKE